MKKTNEQKIRLSLDVTPALKQQIDELQEKSNAATLAEMFRRSLAVYEMVVDQIANNGKVVLENADGTREVIRLV